MSINWVGSSKLAATEKLNGVLNRFCSLYSLCFPCPTKLEEAVTACDVAAKLRDGYARQILAILDRLTAEGIVARFRMGFVNYYVSTKEALTGEKPTLRDCHIH